MAPGTPAADDDPLLFVYGTLRKSYVQLASTWRASEGRETTFLDPPRVLLELGVAHVGIARLQGFELFDVGSYPGIRRAERAADPAFVVGDVFRIPRGNAARVWNQLDAYEECCESDPQPHEYTRCVVSVQLDANGMATGSVQHVENAWAYVYAWDSHACARIEHGDYILYLEQKALRRLDP
ncbi:hypothetical protein FVE85_5802 [Porphyridium purpureum]|uniref:Gamma-glutamylcyclotransferase AIG2-like domain-containing protein n=1 Tax=Porphyridium purpureum TaxID=35688 RepID=A0A5J4Z6E2_PORPP|nr:hypothetical protein FVE85_5802 [Porphyridium purpureum]|eukprot:POR0434..scf295_1